MPRRINCNDIVGVKQGIESQQKSIEKETTKHKASLPRRDSSWKRVGFAED
jgi:hypothetical protein